VLQTGHTTAVDDWLHNTADQETGSRQLDGEVVCAGGVNVTCDEVR